MGKGVQIPWGLMMADRRNLPLDLHVAVNILNIVHPRIGKMEFAGGRPFVSRTLVEFVERL